jgi:hypothetical protein
MQLNPVAAFNPQTAGYPPVAGISPHHLQLAQILAARASVPQLLAASPWTSGLNNPLLQNPLIAATLENPLMNPIFAQAQFGAQPYPFNPYIGQSVPQFGHNGSPYGQIPPQFGQNGSPYGQIAPQFGQMGSPYGQIPPQFGQMGSPYGQIAPQFGQMGSPYGQIPPQFGQIGLPYGQIPPQFGHNASPYGQFGSIPAPQSWVGQPGLSGLYGSPALGQLHPLVSQLAGRGFPGAGMFPTGL